jgi:hypothetical protein
MALRLYQSCSLRPSKHADIYNVSFDNHFSSTILLINVPTPCETSTRNSSPSFNKFLGSDDHPTPAGVPVRMMVPGLSVVPCERNETILGTVKIRSLEAYHRVSHARWKNNKDGSTHSSLLSCTTFPFLLPLIYMSPMFSTLEAGTNAGPIGHAPSNDFE